MKFHGSMRFSTGPISCFAFALLTASPLAAQQDDARADALTAEALSAASSTRDWLAAARLHEASGRLRAGGDARSTASFVDAARFYYYAGELRDSERMFEAAGESAHDGGDAFTAALAYLDGASVAAENGRHRASQKLGWRAEALSRDPGLDPEHRLALARRFRVLHGD